MTKKITLLLGILAAVALPALALADAPVKYYSADTTLTVGSIPVVIKDGSSYRDLSVSDNAITVTLGDGDVMVMRQPGPFPYGLETGGLYASCNVLKNRDNQLIMNGPANVQVVPNLVPCATDQHDKNTTSIFTFSNPAGGEHLTNGQSYTSFWSLDGRIVSSVSLALSTDGGNSYPTTLVSGAVNGGYFAWTVPDVTTDQARLRLVGLDQGRIVAVAVSKAFSIQGTQPAAASEIANPPATTAAAPAHGYDPQAELLGSMNVDDGVGFTAPAGGLVKGDCTPGLRIKGESSSAVYYCGRDGKRHAFPNQNVHNSWFTDFNGVVTVSDSELAQIQLGQNVLYRPGARLIKLTTDPKVYAVSKGGVLRWIETEAAARDLYGDDWNKKVDDVPDTFFADYTVGESIK